MDTFFADVTEARARYNARQTESPIIAWITDPNWAPVLLKDKVSKRWKLPQMFRGLPGSNGSVWQGNGRTLYAYSGVVSGEINDQNRATSNWGNVENRKEKL